MISLRARLFHQSMKIFFGILMPANMPLETYRKASKQPLFERMPRGISWEPRDVGGISGEWITPKDSNVEQILLYLHGGGYVLSTPHVHRVLVGKLARAIGCQAFIPEYRLAPENPFPAALDDVVMTYRSLLKMSYPASQIVVAGDPTNSFISPIFADLHGMPPLLIYAY